MVLRIAGLVLMLVVTAAQADEVRTTCYSRAETRELIHADKLVEPFGLLRSVAGTFGAEALGAKLCRLDGTLVYEINLLDRTGRIIRATVDAATGRPRGKSR